MYRATKILESLNKLGIKESKTKFDDLDKLKAKVYRSEPTAKMTFNSDIYYFNLPDKTLVAEFNTKTKQGYFLEEE